MGRNGAWWGAVEPVEIHQENQRIFVGTVVHALDAKNRVTVPSRWRLDGDAEYYAIPDAKKPFVSLVLADEIERLIKTVKSNESFAGRKGTDFLRQFFARATPCPLDKSGRVVLPAAVCAAAGLEGEVVLAGTGRNIEIWSQKAWNSEIADGAEAFDAALEELGL